VPFCETCGTEHADADRFCATCGNVLPGTPAARPGAPSAAGGGFPTALVAVAAVVVVALIALAFLLLRGGDDDAATAKAATAGPTETAGGNAAQSSRDEPGDGPGAGTGTGTGAGTGGGTGGGRNRAANDQVQATVTADGLTLRHPAGVTVEVPAGVLPEGAAVEIQPTTPPDLPAGVTPVGDFYRITTSIDLTGLATLRLPIPRGAATEELAVYQLRADGQLVSYEGSVEGGFYVAELDGFTDEGLGSGPALKISLDGPAELLAGAAGEFRAFASGGSGNYELNFTYDQRALASSSIATLSLTGESQILYLVYEAGFEVVNRSVKVEVSDLATGRRAAASVPFQLLSPALEITQVNIPTELSFNSETGMLSVGFRICIVGGERTPYLIDIEIPGGAVSTAEISTPGAKPAVAEAACGTLTREFAFEPGLPITAVAVVTDAAGSGPVSQSLLVPTTMQIGVEIRGPSTVTAGVAGEFTAVATGGWPEYSYRWTVTTPGRATTAYADPAISHTFAEPGTHTVAITLGDRSTYTATASLAVEVEAAEEFGVTIVVNPAVPSVGQRFTLTAVVTGAPAGVPLRYVWSLGEQDVETDDPILEIRPDVPGFINIGVSVIDDQNGVAVGAFHELEIVAIAPLLLSATGPAEPLEPGDTATFEIDLTGGVTIDEAGEELFYGLTIDFGDGAVEFHEIPSPGAFIGHPYPDAGRYPVTFTATSSDGQTASFALTVQVGEVADDALGPGFTAVGTVSVVLQSEFGARTRMEYSARAEYEIHLLADGTVTVAAAWDANTYYLECYGLGDDADSPERGELRQVETRAFAFNFSGTHADDDLDFDTFDQDMGDDSRVDVGGDGAHTATTVTGYISLDYTTNLSADPEGDTCASMTVTYDFQILTSSPIPASE
jgi:hypothetical protein